jgi:hypothetical protein
LNTSSAQAELPQAPQAPQVPQAAQPKTVNMAELWEFLPKADEIRLSTAGQRLAVGGTGSGKSANTLMFAVIDYLLRWDGCAALMMRRTFPELEAGLIKDFKAYVPECLLKGGSLKTGYNESKHKVTFINGSTIQFGHLSDGTERSLHAYLGSRYPFILLDEAAQFSMEAWEMLKTRNQINPECKPNGPEKGTTQYPVPVIIGTTNPIGPYWPQYKLCFVDKKPVVDTPGARRDKHGRYWVKEEGIESEYRLLYNPDDFHYVQSMITDNPHLMAKDPGIYARLNAITDPELRKKFLFGSMDGISGQYFSNYDPSRHTLNTRRFPDVLTFQSWQPRWMGMDFGRAHYCTVYWFTKALLSRADGTKKLVAVCYREYVTKGKNNVQLADEMARLSRVVDPETNKVTVEKIQAIYFSHEKFAKQMEAHSPADEFSRLLRQRGLPAVTPATRDRAGRASLTYNMLDQGNLIILDTCSEIMSAIPALIRDEKNIEDVLKIDNKADDCYDGFSYGLFGYLNTKPKPQTEKDRERIDGITDPFAKSLEVLKVGLVAQKRREELSAGPKPAWQLRLKG